MRLFPGPTGRHRPSLARAKSHRTLTTNRPALFLSTSRPPPPFRIEMRLQPTTRLLLLALLPAATLGKDEFDAPSLPRTATLYSWPLSAPTPAPFATVSFNARSLMGTYAPIENAPSPSSPNELVRVGTTDEKKAAAAGSVTAGRLVGKASGVEIILRLDAAGNAWHVQLSEDPTAVCPSSTQSADDGELTG